MTFLYSRTELPGLSKFQQGRQASQMKIHVLVDFPAEALR
jgi:hypothetical protein